MITGNKFIFVSFENGGGGHRLGRIISCLPDVYWYSHKWNGIKPWNVHFTETAIKQRHVSKYHFDRLVPLGMLPPTHDYVNKFIPNEQEYYEKFYYPEFEKMGGYEIIKTHRLVLCSHAMPEVLHNKFPDAKILNIIDDHVSVASRYLKTTAIFPAHLKMKWLDGENTPHGKKLSAIAAAVGPGFTVRDIWCYERYGCGYSEAHEEEYNNYVFNLIETNMNNRKSCTTANTLTVKKNDYKQIKDFLYDR